MDVSTISGQDSHNKKGVLRLIVNLQSAAYILLLTGWLYPNLGHKNKSQCQGGTKKVHGTDDGNKPIYKPR